MSKRATTWTWFGTGVSTVVTEQIVKSTTTEVAKKAASELTKQVVKKVIL